MNTDWNSPQGDFDTAEKQGELLMLLSRQQVTVHTWSMAVVASLKDFAMSFIWEDTEPMPMRHLTDRACPPLRGRTGFLPA